MPKICVICSSVNSKYRCPKCYAHYCSAICCKLHKIDDCELFLAALKPKSETVEMLTDEEDEEPEVDPTAGEVDLRDLQSVSKDQLEIILENPQLKSFREHMTGSNKFSDAVTKAMAEPQQEPMLMELANSPLNNTEDPDKKTGFARL